MRYSPTARAGQVGSSSGLTSRENAAAGGQARLGHSAGAQVGQTDRSLGVLSKNFLTSPVTYSRTCHKLFFLFLTPPLSFSEERTNKQQAQNSNMGGSHESVNQRREVSFPKRTTKWWVHCINRHKTHNSVLLRKSPMGAAGKFHVALSFSWAKC